MSMIDIERINLNLLPALDALLASRSVTLAARRMHVSQSAMSHSLAKLRELFEDPLLVPAGRTLVLTPRASELALSVPRALATMTTALEPSRRFDPKTSTRIFRLATWDLFEFTSIGRVLLRLRSEAPLVRLEIQRFSAETLEPLRAGETDLAIVSEQVQARVTGLQGRELLRDPFMVIARKGHPKLRGRKLTLETYLSQKHVLVSVEHRSDGVVDRALAKMGRARTVALRVPHFTSAPLAVMSSDHLSTVGRALAERAAELFPILTFPSPIPLPEAGVVGLWSRSVESDEANRWFRELIFDAASASPSRSSR